MMMLALVLAAAFQLPPQKSDAVIGVAAVDLDSGARVSVRTTERFPMASVYKIPIALEVLHRVDTGTLQLDRVITISPKEFAPGFSPLRDRAKGQPIVMTVGELLDQMVRVSDNTASDALLRLVSPMAVNRRLAELAIGGIRVDRSERELGADARDVERFTRDARDTSTPDGMLSLLVAIAKSRDGLSRESRRKLLDWMTKTTTGPKRIRAGLPPGAVIAHKTGTGPGVMNDVALIDVALIKERIVIVIFTKGAKSSDADVEGDIAAVTRAVWSALAK
jgi:beta-lactamase class A